MLTIDEARAVVLGCASRLARDAVPFDQTLPLDQALGRVLAEDVVALNDVPSFVNSAMDGFAFAAPGGDLAIVGESRAGAPFGRDLAVGEAVRISTGSLLPHGADAVAPIERAEVEAGRVRAEARPGENVRHPGEDLQSGEVVLQAGATLRAADLGVAAAAGRATVLCAIRPRVALVATGDELVAPGEPLGPGEIHDSTAVALAAIAGEAGAEVTGVLHAGDDRAATVRAIERGLRQADLLLVVGGVSVGAHDHVKPALHEVGVEERFWRVALRPGKPIWFGTNADALVLALPGNPVSALVGFVLFGRPALRALQGASPMGQRVVKLAECVARQPDREEASRVVLDEAGWAHLHGSQGSHILSSMAGADGLAIVPRGATALPAGSTVEFIPL